MRFALLGAAIGIGNRGVSALGASTIRLVSEAAPGSSFSLLIGDQASGSRRITLFGNAMEVPVVNYRLHPAASLQVQICWILMLSGLYRILPMRSVQSAIRNRNSWIRTVAESDVVADIRGGDSFSDIYGVKNFFLGSLPILSVLLVRGRIDLLPQTYGPFTKAPARWLARWILRRTGRIMARDTEGPSAVRALLGTDREVTVTPDVAFCLEPVTPSTPDIRPPLPTARPPLLVGINVNGLMYNGGYTRSNMFGLKLDYPDFLRRLMPQILQIPDTHILLVPHTFAPAGNVESDPEASRKVLHEVPEPFRSRVHLVEREYDQHEIKGVIGMCDFFIGSRMHACIAALSQGIPCIGVAYSKKFVGVFASVGMQDWIIDGRDVDASQATEQVQERLAIRDTVKGPLRERVKEAQNRLREAFQDMLSTGPGRSK